MRKLLAILLRLAAEVLWPSDQRARQVLIVPEPDETETQECPRVRLDETEEMPRFDTGWHTPTNPYRGHAVDWRDE